MAFDKLIETLRKEIEDEMSLREEIMYKKGFAAGIENSKVKKLNECNDDYCNNYELKAYIEGVEDAFDTFNKLLTMSSLEKLKIFDSSILLQILNNYEPLEIMDKLYNENIKYDDLYGLIGAILDSDISDSLKRYILGDINVTDTIK